MTTALSTCDMPHTGPSRDRSWFRLLSGVTSCRPITSAPAAAIAVTPAMTRPVLCVYSAFQEAICTSRTAPGFGLGVGTPESAPAATSPPVVVSVSNAASTAQLTPLRALASA